MNFKWFQICIISLIFLCRDTQKYGWVVVLSRISIKSLVWENNSRATGWHNSKLTSGFLNNLPILVSWEFPVELTPLWINVLK